MHRIQAAIALREAGVDAPVLLLGHAMPSAVDLILSHGITPTLVDWETARLISATGRWSRGSPRQGRHRYEPLRAGARKGSGLRLRGRGLPNLKIQGLFSHFASADEPNLDFAHSQWEHFQAILQAISDAGHNIPMPHICNSAGIITMPEAHLAAVRPGCLIYGMAPSPESVPHFPLRRALTLKSTIIKVRDLAPGTTISYGRTFITQAAHPRRPGLAGLW